MKPTPHGLHAGRRGRGQRLLRAYDVWFDDAGEASCSCPDFAKAALGLCKHVLAVLALK